MSHFYDYFDGWVKENHRADKIQNANVLKPHSATFQPKEINFSERRGLSHSKPITSI